MTSEHTHLTKLVEQIRELIAESQTTTPFSGVIRLQMEGELVFAEAYGYANRSEQIPNTLDTRFGIASGTKTFTAVAVAQLIERGLLSLDTQLHDCLNVEFPHFDPQITVHNLLCHTSGMPDYFNEEESDDYASLWANRPMYNFQRPADFLPLFQYAEMQFTPGNKFQYNNAAYIVLGLIVEELSQLSYTEYVKRHIFAPAGMADSGFFRLDKLPARTASGYILEEGERGWRTNIYSIPVLGGPDGGAMVTAPDLAKFWQALLTGQLLGKDMLEKLLTPHAHAFDNTYYGYGLWMAMREDQVYRYYMLGEDPGATCISNYYSEGNIQLTLIGNTNMGIFPIGRGIQNLILS